MYSGHYVGYSALEDLLAEAERIHATVYADTVSIKTSQPTGAESNQNLILAAFFNGEVTHFWNWGVSSFLTTMQGEPIDLARAERADRALESAWDRIHTHLEDKAARVVRAAASLPQDMTHMSGRCPEFLEYDPKTALYSKQEASHAA